MTRTRPEWGCATALALALGGMLAGATAHAGGSIKRGLLEQVLGKEPIKENPFKKTADMVNKIQDLIDKGAKGYEGLKDLSPDDKQYEPQPDLPGTPELPSLCKDSRVCEQCFKGPYEDLQNTRFRFEKLRRVNRVTKNMLRDSISFGDAAASAAGGLAPLAWNSEKTKIRASEKSFNQSYDAKHAELLGTLEQALQGIAACEEDVFGELNWYERYGFVYQQFMAEAYRRPD